MKKRNILSVLALSGLAMNLAFVNLSTEKTNYGLEASTIDFVNEKANIDKVAIRKASNSSEKFDMSKTYVQWAYNETDGYDYLRFATAVSGDYNSISYTRHIEGIADETQSVTAVYKGISAAGETMYSNGDSLRNLNLSSTKDYYWACYTIRFVSNNYKASDITVTIDVDGKTQSRTTSLTDLQGATRLGDGLKDGYSLSNLATIKERFVLGSDTNLYDFNEGSPALPTGVTVINSGLIQGMTTDGTNIYYAMAFDQGSYNYYKYDPTTGTHTKIMSGGKDGTKLMTGDMPGIKYIDGIIYAVSTDGYIPDYGYNVSAKKWAVNPYKEHFGHKDNYQIRDFVRNPVTKKYAVLDSKNVFKFYDSSLAYLEGKDVNISTRPIGLSAGTIKSLDCDDKYIYVLYVNDGYHGIRLAVYDWDGAYVDCLQYSNPNIFKHNDKSKVSTFTILNNKIYMGAISWAVAPYSSEMYSMDFTINEKTERMSLNEIMNKTTLFNIDNSEVEFKLRHKVSASNGITLQSACTDGKYIYYSINDGSNLKTTIVKYDAETYSMVGQTKVGTISAEESYSDTSNLFYYNGRVYLIGAQKLYSVDANAIDGASEAEITEDTTLPWFPNVGRNGTAAYNPELKVFVISNSSGVVNKYSEDGTLLTTTGVQFTMGGQGIGLSTNGKDLYYCRSSQATYTDAENVARAYDSIIVQRMNWDLEKVGAEFHIGSSNNPIGETTTKRGSNMQTFLDVNGKLLVGRLVFQQTGAIAAGSYIYEVDYKCKDELAKYDTTYTLGEHIESAELNGTTPTYSLQGGVKNVGGTYLQGAVVVGDYIYYTNSSNKSALIGRYNPYTRTAKVADKADAITLNKDTNGDYGKIFYYDNSLWLIDSSGKFIGADLETLKANGRTLTLSNLPSGVIPLDCGYSEESNTLVVLGKNGNLYLFDKDLNLTKTITGARPSTGSLYSVTVSGYYIYVNSNGNGMQGVGLRVYDIRGNEIADTSLLINELGIASTMKACKVLDFNGVAILTVLGWNPTTGCRFYQINMQ